MRVIETILVCLGFTVIAVSVFLYFRLMRNTNLVQEQIDSTTSFIFKAYLFLMVFFLLSYALIGVSIFMGVSLNNIHVVGLLLFFGGIFVFIGIIAQTRLANCIHNGNIQLVRSLVSVVEARDENLKGHSLQVRGISLLIYDNLPKHLSRQLNRQKLEYASLMHDLGKLGIPESILNKPAKLDYDEWQLMKEHPKIGVNIIKDIVGISDIKDWILYHHERIDGQGYHGLKGNQIPLASKIICIADVYSAIIMRRSYKEPRPHSEALEIMSASSGSQFDAQILSIFMNIEETKVKAATENL